MPRRRGTSGFLAIVLVALGVAGGGLLSGCGGTGSSARPASRTAASRRAHASTGVVTISGIPYAQPIPSGFLGFSMELPSVELYAGRDPRTINPAFAALVRNLAAGGSPVLRIGGDSTDWSWWPAPHMAKPPWARFTLTPTWMSVARALAEATNGRLILGVNLEADSISLARAESSAMTSQIGAHWIQAFEIGNEPELYGSFSWYKTSAGVHVHGRGPTYGFNDFLGDFHRFAAALPNLPLAGPSSGAPHWMPLIGQFASAEPRAGLITVHDYPLKHCSASHIITDAELLASSSSIGLAHDEARVVAAAHSHHRKLRIDEMNGVSCGGVRGVSNAFASSLWVLDTLFALARTGVDGINIHTIPGAINEIIGNQFTHGQWRESVHPEYYGMLMFAQAAPVGSRLLRVIHGTRSGLDVWATKAPDHSIHVVFVNSSTATSRTVRLKIPGRQGTATVERLTGPAVSATSGVKLGGQSFGAYTTTGQLTGRSTNSPLSATNGLYAVKLPAASAAMVTLPATS